MKECQSRLLRASSHRRMPWKNGLGVTTEILIDPSDATIGNFDWRLSMARIDADGPFSSFPNIDRLLVVLEGCVHLEIEGRPAIALTPDDAPIRFPGELAVSATLITAPGALPRPAIDLNLMVRRGSYEAEMRRVVVERVGQYRPSADIIALLCRTAGLRISSERDSHSLQCDDVVLLRGQSPPLHLSHTSSAVLYAVELHCVS